MLRSRGNRPRRPSGTIDETSRRISHPFGGYPPHDPEYKSPMAGVFSGAAQDTPSPPLRTRSFGSSTLGGYNSVRGSVESPGKILRKSLSVGSKRFPTAMCGDAISFGRSSAASVLFSLASAILLLLGGSTFYYRRNMTRLQADISRSLRLQRTFHERRGRAANFGSENLDATGNSDQIDGRDTLEINREYDQLQSEATRLANRNLSIQSSITELRSYISTVEEETIKVESKISELREESQSYLVQAEQYRATFKNTQGNKLTEGKSVESQEELDELVKKREDALWEKIDSLTGKIQRESKREAIEWFGPGPHYVEIEIEYPTYEQGIDPSEWPRVRGTFVVELAPLDLMPHSVNLFLHQVHHKLWNGCTFVINAMHILQAGPHVFVGPGEYEANAPSLLENFQNVSLDKLAFQEYSFEYPHSKYTLGFAGRPGGPDFYINKIDNSANHGPGGQNHHDLHEEADPSFGKIVEGAELLVRINRIPSDRAKGGLLVHPVVIVDTKVINQNIVTPEQEKSAHKTTTAKA